MNRRKIVTLKFDNWTHFSVSPEGSKKEFLQPLIGFAELKIDQSRQKGIQERAESQLCHCCGCPMAVVEEGILDDAQGSHHIYSACSACGFWRLWAKSGINPPNYWIPSIREFDPGKEMASLSYLTEEISKHPDKLYQMEPYQFERFVGSVFRNCFNCDVYHVGQSGDDGVDLYAIVKDQPFLIQVKRRSEPTATEGVNVVKLLFASAFAQGGNQGAVITTAQKFSIAAHAWTQTPRLADISFKILLVDFASLMSMVNCVAQKGDPPPWIAHKSARPYRFISEEEWTVANHEHHDVLIHSEDLKTTALIFEHRSLEDCIVLSGASQIVAWAVENWAAKRRTELSAEMGVRLSLHRNDGDLANNVAIPFTLCSELSERWIALYPERVIDATP